MIHLFRKARRKLLDNNLLRKYLLYALGEIILVMIGILLALYISNWNGKKADTKKEIWYLDNIANDMFYQKDGLQELKINFTETLTVAKGLLLDYKKLKSYAAIDSLSYKLNLLMVTYSYPNINNTYSELLSSGQVALIENDDLISDVIDFYLNTNELDLLFKTNEKQVFYGEVYNVLNKYAEIDITQFADNDALLFRDLAVENYIKSQLNLPQSKLVLTNAIKNKILIVTDYLMNVDESIKDVDRMIAAIDDEIDKLK